MNTFSTLLALVAILGFSPSGPLLISASRADDLLGAEKILQTTAAQNPEGAAKLNKQKQHRRRMWGHVEVTPAPAKTAAEWLALYEKSIRPAYQMLFAVERVSTSSLLEALPPPEEWEALKKEILARPEASGRGALREIGLRLLADILTGDQAGLEKNLASAKSLAASPSTTSGEQVPVDYVLNSFIEEAHKAKLRQSDDPAEILVVLNNTLVTAERNGKNYPPVHYSIPDVVTMIGEEQAADYLRRALRAPDLQIEITAGEETVQLAQKIALEELASLKSAPWGLVCSIDDVEFYEALKARFLDEDASTPERLKRPAGASMQSSIQMSAQTYYVLGLIARGRVEEATATVLKGSGDDFLSIPQNALEALTRAGHRKAVIDFLRQLLAQKPALALWPDYIALSTEAGESREMLAFLRHTLEAHKENKELALTLRAKLASALLAADEIDDGIEEMQQLLSVLQSPAVASLEEEKLAEQLEDGTSMAYKLVEIGILLDRKPLIEDGLKATRQIIDTSKKLSTQHIQSSTQRATFSLAELLSKLNRHDEAEAVLAKELGELVALSAETGASSDASINASAIRNVLMNLVAFYHNRDRPADIVTLLDKAPFWGGSDLAEYYNETVRNFLPGNTTVPLGHIVASALAATGRMDEARTINRAVLDVVGDCDPAYQLLLKLDGLDALTRLDTLFARDRFQERPLIWKAHLLLTSKKLEEAEATIRKAIAIDPSDGESSAGERMRAYAVLADIREARGDAEEAAFFREVVKAIRLSEQADLFKHVGLLTRAIAIYKEALTHFADAYCIQSRLARNLALAGRNEEASAHYRRAFELMPDSFGLVESHCFGCEQAFQGENVQTIAETVFTEAAAKTPDKPQTHYLLGYLRTEQRRHREALSSYLVATQLDPDYLNAWKKIRDTASYVHVPGAVQDDAAFTLLRLDPLDRHHSHFGLREVSSLRRLWQAADAAARQQPVLPTTLYPLAASKAVIEQSGEKSTGPGRFRRQEARTPAEVIGRHGLITALQYLLQ